MAKPAGRVPGVFTSSMSGSSDIFSLRFRISSFGFLLCPTFVFSVSLWLIILENIQHKDTKGTKTQRKPETETQSLDTKPETQNSKLFKCTYSE